MAERGTARNVSNSAQCAPPDRRSVVHDDRNGVGYQRKIMTSRKTSRTVTFRHPFLLDGFGREQPAGTYIVDTEEELLDTVLFQAWKRTSTLIRLGGAGRIDDVPIDPEQLNFALLQDHAQDDSEPPFAAHT